MALLPELSTLAWVALALGAFLVGISKTAIPGFNTVSVALFASVLPAKASTGALLLLLMVGDIFALLAYRKHAHWPTLIRMVPAVLLGLVAGAAFLYFASDTGVRRGIGILLLVLIGLTLWQRHRATAPPLRRGRIPALTAPLPPLSLEGWAALTPWSPMRAAR